MKAAPTKRRLHAPAAAASLELASRDLSALLVRAEAEADERRAEHTIGRFFRRRHDESYLPRLSRLVDGTCEHRRHLLLARLRCQRELLERRDALCRPIKHELTREKQGAPDLFDTRVPSGRTIA